MNNLDYPQCQLCSGTKHQFITNYLGSFLSCTQLIQCQSCELVFADKFPSKKDLDKYYSTGFYYDKVSDPFNPEFTNFSTKLSRSRLNLIYSKIVINEKLRVIDIGAGNAQFGIVLKEFYNSVDYDVVEPDAEVRSKYEKWVKNQFSDISEIKLGGYDLAIMNQILEHVSDPIGFLGSIYKLLKPNGYVYIDVPYQDYLFKPNLEPHLLFWNQKSITTLIKNIGLKMIFCDTAGMLHSKARRLFNQQSIFHKIGNIWVYAEKVNRIFTKIGLPEPFDTFLKFQSDKYGGDRQWLRCIAQKTL